MIRVDVVTVTVLMVLVTASALGVVNSQHHARKLRNALEHEQSRNHGLEVEWRQLQVEQGTKAAHGGVEKFAREQLKMLPPHPGQIVVLEGRP